MSAAAVPYTVNVPFGNFDLEGHNVKGILEKPTYSFFANADIYLIKGEVIEEIPDGQFLNATDLMDKLIAEGKSVMRYPITCFWQDIGSKEEFAKAQELVKHIDEM